MQEKKFDEWNTIKKRKEMEKRIYFRVGQIWMMHIGENIGDEEDGKGGNFLRPTLVFKKFNKNIFLGIPLTTSQKQGKFYSPFPFNKKITSVAILSQLRLFDAKRLLYKKGKVSPQLFQEISNALKKFLFN